jgi:hypothetical protein
MQCMNATLRALKSNETHGTVFLRRLFTAVNAAGDRRYAEAADGPLPSGWLLCEG